MRKLIVLCAALAAALASLPVSAQIPAPGSVNWSTEAVPVKGEPGVCDVIFTARITPGWHLYDLGPYEIEGLATGFDFVDSKGIELVGAPREVGSPTHKMDETFGFETGYFEPEGRFAQRVRVVAGAGGGNSSGTELAGEVEYQICRDEVGCIRGVWEFSVSFRDRGASDALSRSGDQGRTSGTVPDRPTVGQSVISTPADENPASDGAEKMAGGVSGGGDVPIAASPVAEASAGGFWSTILSAIGWALLALLTPCVFPMIPMTVTFFLKDGSNPAKAKFRAIMFGVFIVSIFTLPIAVLILAARFGGGEAVTADIFNWLATHWIPNVLFFIVFMIFAASLLGAFEIRLPSGLLNRSDKNADRAGMIGVFFLALTLVLVSFSCTVPIVGSAIIQSVGGEFWRPIATMLVFSMVFALPFTFFAFFPRIMERLPQSGGWLNSVKVILGLVEIALGLKFLSVADQTYHWGILDREVYLAIWIVVFSLLGFYLLGKIRFRHDSPVESVGVGRLAMAIVVFSFVVWMIPGLWGAPLKAISGYLPPMSTQDFVMGGAGSTTAAVTTGSATEKVKYADILHLPHGLAGYFDLEQGMAAARAAGKPVFLDFTGHGCVNCREMEQRVWIDGEVQRILREEFVIIALYSDDRTALPRQEWLTTPNGRVLKTLGRKNSHIVNTRYGVSAQPAYLLLDGEGELLAPVYGYNLDIAAFVAFLRQGAQNHEKR